MLIVGFSGKKDAGKDTGANFLAAEFLQHANPRIKPRTMGMAMPLKKLCAKWFGVPLKLSMGTDDDKNTVMEHMLWENQPERPEGKAGPMTVREILQHWGTNVLRKTDPDVHVRAWKHEAEQLKKGSCPLLFVPDVRFPNEVQALLEAGGPEARIVRLTRHPHEGDEHESETALDDFAWTKEPRLYVLDNSSGLAAYKRDLRRWFFHTFRDVL